MARKGKLIHINSKDISGSSPKLIDSSQLNNGEIAINYADGYEVLQIKNSTGNIVTFPSKLVGYKESTQSGGNLDLKNTDTIIEAFGKVAKHLSDIGSDKITKTEVNSLLAGKADKSHTHTTSQITDLENIYAKKTEIPAEYVLPTASSTTLGGVKVGAGLRIDSGVLSATGGGTADSVAWGSIVGIPDDVANITTKLSGKADKSTTLAGYNITDGVNSVALDGTGNAVTNASITNHKLTLTKGSTYALKTEIPTQVSQLSNDSGYVNSAALASGLSGKANVSHTHTASQITDLTNTLSTYAKKSDIPAEYTLPTASSTTLGGVKVGAGLRIDSGVLSATGGGTADSVAWENIVGIPDDVANITTKLSGKANVSHTHTGSDIKGLTGLRALATDTNGNIVVSSVTSTELGYLDGVTSNIQTQLSGKAASSHTHVLSQISDLYTTWLSLLQSAPSQYVTRWPTFSEVGSRPTTLAGYGITDGVNEFQTSGSGNALSSVTILDGGHVIKFAKDFTFAEQADVQDAITYSNTIGYASRTDMRIPLTNRKRVNIISLSSDSQIYLQGSILKAGYDMLYIIHNTSASNITVTIPNSGGFISTDKVDSITIAPDEYGEISIMSDGTNMYLRSV